MADVYQYPDLAALVEAAAERFVAAASAAVDQHGAFYAVLAGGSTPRPVYERLAVRSREVDWTRAHLFWGDERCVPPEHADSNYRMAYEALIRHVRIPADQVHRMRGELPPEQAAADYEALLRRHFTEPRRAAFDLVLLGMGDDGHTASLFPGSSALVERKHWVQAVYVDKLAAWRLTLTPPALNSAEMILFLVSGTGKAAMLRTVLQGVQQPDLYPAQAINPVSGGLSWLVDADAAQMLARD